MQNIARSIIQLSNLHTPEQVAEMLNVRITTVEMVVWSNVKSNLK